MKNIIGLCRVSTRMQGETMNGLDSQRTEITRWAEYNGYNLITVMDEVASGGLPLSSRPIMSAALALAKKMKAQVVTTKVDRCSRVSAIANDLLGRGVVSTIELAGQTDEFVSYLHAGLAARELRVGSARTKAGMAAAMARGVIMGNRTNLPEAQESGRQAMRSKSDKFAALMRPTISRMRSAGMTYEAIAVELNVMGVSTARALSTRSAWHGSSVRNVVNRWGNNAMA